MPPTPQVDPGRPGGSRVRVPHPMHVPAGAALHRQRPHGGVDGCGALGAWAGEGAAARRP
eukprot:362322-Chlamydomonas_euryale.AAC.25